MEKVEIFFFSIIFNSCVFARAMYSIIFICESVLLTNFYLFLCQTSPIVPKGYKYFSFFFFLFLHFILRVYSKNDIPDVQLRRNNESDIVHFCVCLDSLAK